MENTLISPEEITQILLSAYTLSGQGCEDTQCNTEISCTVNPHKKNGVPKASDVHTGHIVVSVTIGQYGSTVPTVTPGSGWEMSGELTCDDPDSDTPTWTCQLTKPLEKELATSGGNQS